MVAEGGLSILEASPGVTAIIVVFFLVITLGIDFLLRQLYSFLRRRKKLGLLAAVEHLSSELMLLGVASLLLMAITPSLSNICLPTERHMRSWLSHVNGCACCLARTRGVTDCFLEERQCPADFEQTCAADPWSLDASAARRRRLAAGSSSGSGGESTASSCSGPYPDVWAACDYRPGYAPAVTPSMLEEVHMFLFVTAVAHILASILALLMSTTKLWFWRQVAGADCLDGRARRAREAQQGLHGLGFGSTGVLEMQAPTVKGSVAAANGSPVPQGELLDVDPGGDLDTPRAADPGSAPAHAQQVPAAPGAPPAPGVGEARSGARQLVGYDLLEWRGRAEKLQGAPAHLKEAGLLLLRQFTPWTITRQEYSIIRSCFFLTHPVSAPPSADIFHPYLLESLERDGAHVVGLGVTVWGLIVVFVLLSGFIGWCAWLFTTIAGMLLLYLNTHMLHHVRHITRGGAIHTLSPSRFWLRHPHLLLPIIKTLLFCVSFVIGNSAYFAAFFGPRSCFFSRTGFQKNPVPWYGIMIADAILLLFLSTVTLPLYSLLVHTAALDEDVLRQLQLDATARAASGAGSWGSPDLLSVGAGQDAAAAGSGVAASSRGHSADV